MITQVKYLPRDENVPGANPVQVNYDNGTFAVFNYTEESIKYEEIQAWEAAGNTIQPADS